jgi:hypothetical protein
MLCVSCSIRQAPVPVRVGSAAPAAATTQPQLCPELCVFCVCSFVGCLHVLVVHCSVCALDDSMVACFSVAFVRVHITCAVSCSLFGRKWADMQQTTCAVTQEQNQQPYQLVWVCLHGIVWMHTGLRSMHVVCSACCSGVLCWYCSCLACAGLVCMPSATQDCLRYTFAFCGTGHSSQSVPFTLFCVRYAPFLPTWSCAGCFELFCFHPVLVH